MERSHYSGKAHRHTSKVQYTSATDGLILHKTRHSPGRIHDFAVFKKKHPTFPDNLPRKDGSKDKKRIKVREILDGGYQGINKEFPDRDAVVPYKKQKGAELSPEQKEFNKKHSKGTGVCGARHPQGQTVSHNGRCLPKPPEKI